MTQEHESSRVYRLQQEETGVREKYRSWREIPEVTAMPIGRIARKKEAAIHTLASRHKVGG
jgi:hypothetical protein